MNKKTAVLVLAFLIIAVSPALAIDATRSTSVRKPIVQQRINTRIEDIREKMASREAALKLKLDSFRDQKKATTAARINMNLNKINENQTASMQKHLSYMSNILDKLAARVASRSPDVKDPSAALAAIANSRATIATTSATVTVQSEKDYTIVVSSESRIKLDAMSQRNLLHEDLLSLRKFIIDAKQSVITAIRTAKMGKKEATSSGQQ